MARLFGSNSNMSACLQDRHLCFLLLLEYLPRMSLNALRISAIGFCSTTNSSSSSDRTDCGQIMSCLDRSSASQERPVIGKFWSNLLLLTAKTISPSKKTRPCFLALIRMPTTLALLNIWMQEVMLRPRRIQSTLKSQVKPMAAVPSSYLRNPCQILLLLSHLSP